MIEDATTGIDIWRFAVVGGRQGTPYFKGRDWYAEMRHGGNGYWWKLYSDGITPAPHVVPYNVSRCHYATEAEAAEAIRQQLIEDGFNLSRPRRDMPEWEGCAEQILEQTFDAAKLPGTDLCVSCLAHGFERPAAHTDHILPTADGGADIPSNWQRLCLPCHGSKTSGENRERSLWRDEQDPRSEYSDGKTYAEIRQNWINKRNTNLGKLCPVP